MEIIYTDDFISGVLVLLELDIFMDISLVYTTGINSW